MKNIFTSVMTILATTTVNAGNGVGTMGVAPDWNQDGNLTINSPSNQTTHLTSASLSYWRLVHLDSEFKIQTILWTGHKWESSLSSNLSPILKISPITFEWNSF